MTQLYPFRYPTPGAGQPMASLATIKAAHDWLMLSPEMQRRVELEMIAGGGKFGFGSGGRTSAEQTALFLTRHHEVPCPGMACMGKCWALDTGEASAACPGSSYHEVVAGAGGALAVDMVGDLTAMHAIQAQFGLHSFESVNNEPWHQQPVEIPNSRSAWKTPAPLPVWGAGPPAIPEDDMAITVKPYDGSNLGAVDNNLLDTATFVLVGGTATWTRNEAALAVQHRLGTIPTSAAKPVMRADLKAYDLVGPAPAGAPGYTYLVPGRNEGTNRSDFANP